MFNVNSPDSHLVTRITQAENDEIVDIESDEPEVSVLCGSNSETLSPVKLKSEELLPTETAEKMFDQNLLLYLNNTNLLPQLKSQSLPKLDCDPQNLKILENKNKFKCEVCGKAFPQQRMLNRHRKNHNPIKKYNCHFCCKGFNDSFDLKRHVRTHTGVKPYKCNLCSKSFTQRCSLENHSEKIHGIKHTFKHKQRRSKLYVCEDCGFTTADVRVHYDHIKTLHSSVSSLNNLNNFKNQSLDLNFNLHASSGVSTSSGCLSYLSNSLCNSNSDLLLSNATLPTLTSISSAVTNMNTCNNQVFNSMRNSIISNQLQSSKSSGQKLFLQESSTAIQNQMTLNNANNLCIATMMNDFSENEKQAMMFSS